MDEQENPGLSVIDDNIYFKLKKTDFKETFAVFFNENIYNLLFQNSSEYFLKDKIEFNKSNLQSGLQHFIKGLYYEYGFKNKIKVNFKSAH